MARKDFPSGAVSYYFSDHLKTTDVVTDAQGNIRNESDFYPWGGELQFSNADSTHYKFTGKERDSETGFDYFGARYYSNGLGRFITPDWAAKATAVPYAEFADPQSLNLYSYVRNIPTTRFDADGHNYVFAPFQDWGEFYMGDGLGDGQKGGGGQQRSSPPSPAPPSQQQAQNTVQTQTDNPKEDTLTNVVYNETGSLRANSKAKPGTSGSADQLHEARVEVAEVAERVLQSKHPERVEADDTLTNQTLHDLAGGNKRVIAALKDSRSAAECARRIQPLKECDALSHIAPYHEKTLWL